MHLERRRFLRLLARAGALLVGARFSAWASTSTALSAPALALRSVESDDAGALQAIMTSCVADADAFFGKCGEWSLGWAKELIARCPDTLVLHQDATPVAFLEVPPIRAAAPSPDAAASAEQVEAHAVRERNRTTFRVTAAGVRDDLLSREESVRVFRAVLYQGFVRARALGYEAVEAVAPWEQHPRLPRRWTEYPGCELVEPVSVSEVDGKALYWLRWTLDDAIAALAAEGAGDIQPSGAE
jgi:hypothetical protein